MAEAARKLAATARQEEFVSKYKGTERLWTGPSFIQCHDLKTWLAELPVSSVAVPTQEYQTCRRGNQDYIFGELLYTMMGYAGYLRDKAWPVQECFLRALIRPATFILAGNITYQTAAGDQTTWTAEVLRTGENRYLYFLSYYRPF